MTCDFCGESLVDKRKGAKYCSRACLVRAQCKKKSAEPEEYSPRGNNDGRSQDKRAARLRTMYGITIEQYEGLLEKQNNSCAVCERDAGEFKTRLAVDHNHGTGEIRGLLCSYCNHRLVGRWKDANLLRKIADYVDQGTGWHVPEHYKTGRPRRRKKLVKSNV